jgi:uncharacterized protein YcfL
MKKYALIILTALMVFSLVLAGCTPQTQISTAAQTMVAQTLTAMAVVTDTPEPTATSTLEPTATNTPTEEPAEPEVVAFGPTGFPRDVNPLTGLKVTADRS